MKYGGKEGDLETGEKLDIKPSFISNKENQLVELGREVQQLRAFLGAELPGLLVQVSSCLLAIPTH